MLAAHAIPGAEEVDIPGRTYTRLLTHAGGPARVKMTFAEDGVVANLPEEVPDAQLTVDEARRALLALPGIGPWTADYLTVRAMQHPDTFAPGDLVARRARRRDMDGADPRGVGGAGAQDRSSA